MVIRKGEILEGSQQDHTGNRGLLSTERRHFLGLCLKVCHVLLQQESQCMGENSNIKNLWNIQCLRTLIITNL